MSVPDLTATADLPTIGTMVPSCRFRVVDTSDVSADPKGREKQASLTQLTAAVGGGTSGSVATLFRCGPCA